jgi:hypothetical protein
MLFGEPLSSRREDRNVQFFGKSPEERRLLRQKRREERRERRNPTTETISQITTSRIPTYSLGGLWPEMGGGSHT